MIKEVKIKNKKDLYKFYKKLPLYRSLFYKNVTFIYNENKFEIKEIINALNIKNRKKRLIYIFDTACRQIDDNCKYKNICGFKNGICINHQKLKKDYKNGCCRWCLNQSTKGCTTQNLTCKLFNCTEVEKRCKMLTFEDINVLKLLTRRQKAIVKSNYFTKKESYINDLYIGSFVIWEIKQIFRFIKIFININVLKKSFK